MSSPPPTGGEGLGGSTPLVSLSAVRSSPVPTATTAVPQSLTPTSGNHPLAPPPPPQTTQPQYQQQQPMYPPPPPGSTSIPSNASSSSRPHYPPPPVATPTMVAMPPPAAPPGNSTSSSNSAPFSPSRPAYPPGTNTTGAAPPHQYSTSTAATTTSSSPHPSLPQPPAATTATTTSHTQQQHGSNSVQSLDDLVDAFLSGPSYRTQNAKLPPLLRPPPLVHEDPLQCLRTLVERRAWGDVLQVTADLLNNGTQHSIYYNMLVHNDSSTTTSATTTSSSLSEEEEATIKAETAEVLALQCHAWLKLRRYADLGREIERWAFVTFNDCHHDNNTSLAWVPWSLHILAAETLLYTTDDPNRGTDELFALQSRIPETEVRWKLCADRALVNAFFRKRDWRMAMVLLDRMFPVLENGTRQELQQSTSSTTNSSDCSDDAISLLHIAYKTELLSVQGRLLLQAGAVAEAAILFQEAQTDWKQVESNPHLTKTESSSSTTNSMVKNHVVVQHIPAQLLVNEGLMCFAYSNYDQAIDCFKKATDRLRQCSLTPSYRTEDWIGPSVVGVSPHTTLFHECINNMAICALYTCQMPDAVQLMEGLVREDPTAFLTERVAFNLCTMYELGCDSTASARKKRVLQLVAKRFFLHDVGPESFRIN